MRRSCLLRTDGQPLHAIRRRWRSLSPCVLCCRRFPCLLPVLLETWRHRYACCQEDGSKEYGPHCPLHQCPPRIVPISRLSPCFRSGMRRAEVFPTGCWRWSRPPRCQAAGSRCPCNFSDKRNAAAYYLPHPACSRRCRLFAGISARCLSVRSDRHSKKSCCCPYLFQLYFNKNFTRDSSFFFAAMSRAVSPSLFTAFTSGVPKSITRAAASFEPLIELAAM